MTQNASTTPRPFLSPLFTWRGAICESGLAPTARHVALTLSLHMNERGGSAFPGAETLASETGLTSRTVRDHLQSLTESGWIELVERGGIRGQRRRANHYRASIPESFTPEAGSRVQISPQPLNLDAPTPEGDSPQGVIEGAKRSRPSAEKKNGGGWQDSADTAAEQRRAAELRIMDDHAEKTAAADEPIGLTPDEREERLARFRAERAPTV